MFALLYLVDSTRILLMLIEDHKHPIIVISPFEIVQWDRSQHMEVMSISLLQDVNLRLGFHPLFGEPLTISK